MSKNSQLTDMPTLATVEIWEMFLCSLQRMLCAVPLHFNTTFSSSSYRAAHSVKIPGFTRNSRKVFFSCYCNTYKSLMGAEYTEVFRCSKSPNSRGLRSADREDQLTGPPCPLHCSQSLVQALSDSAEEMR
jgi:hypothetical protein